MSDKTTPGVDLIASERHRQIAKGYTLGIDACLPDGSLAMAAICYAMDEQLFMKTEQPGGVLYSDPWPWDPKFDHRVKSDGAFVYNLPLQERIKRLVKAGALIAAEIDSLQFKISLSSVTTQKAVKTYFAEPEDGANAYEVSRSITDYPVNTVETTKKPAL